MWGRVRERERNGRAREKGCKSIAADVCGSGILEFKLYGMFKGRFLY